MVNKSTDQPMDVLCALRKKLARIERPAAASAALAPLGCHHLDTAIGGGLARGRLHEIFAEDVADSGSAAGFAASLAVCFSDQDQAPIFWLREEAAERYGYLHAPGLLEMGVDPGRMVLAVLPDPVALLRAAADVVRCSSVGVAVIELRHNPRVLDLTVSRRLTLAAEKSGVTVLLLCPEARPGPSAAQTRWSVQAAPSIALEADAPGRSAFTVELLRQRGRPDGGTWHLEWDRDRACFIDQTLSGAVVPLAPDRSLAFDGELRAG